MRPSILARTSVVLAICISLAACGGKSDSSTTQSAADPKTVAPTAATSGDAKPLTATVHSIEATGGQVKVSATFLNPSESVISVVTERRPMELRTESGAVLKSSAIPISIPAHSQNDVEIFFPGEALDGNAALVVNPGSFISTSPELTVSNIPVKANKTLVFSEPETAAAAIDDAVFNHPNGASLVLRRISITTTGVDVSFLAVNGSEREVKLASNSQVTMTDSTGKVLYAIPSVSNSTFSVPSLGRLTGTFHFAGTPAAGADNFTLVANGQYKDTSNAYTTSPTMTLSNIPVPKVAQ